ncbi:MAG: VWA domain-containing protein [Elusimicrobiales bacterium]|nr:VWA domain-containing protein [Elusimicrobiales bacterium]
MEESRSGRGRYVRSRPAESLRGGIALRDTLIRAALEGMPRPTGGVRLSRETLREAVRVEPSGFTILFVVDASDSMGTVKRLSAAKGAALYLLSQAYLRRLKVGMIVFRGDEARTVLEPTSSLSLVRRALASLKVGEATPLAAGLVKAHALAKRVLAGDPSGTVLTAVLTDGEANVPLSRGEQTDRELYALAPGLVHPRIRYLFLDTSPVTENPLMRRLAELTGGRCLHLHPDRGDELLSALEGS